MNYLKIVVGIVLAITLTPCLVAQPTVLQAPYTNYICGMAGSDGSCSLALAQAITGGSTDAVTVIARCGSSTFQIECHPTLVQTYSGTQNGHFACNGSAVDTIPIDTYGQAVPTNPQNNIAIGHKIGVSTTSGVLCLLATFDNANAMNVELSLKEVQGTSVPTLDGSAQLTTDVVATGSNPYSYLGQAMTLAGSNDFVDSGCACGPGMTTVTGAWTATFEDHLAAGYLNNISNSGFTQPTWGGASASPFGIVASIALNFPAQAVAATATNATIRNGSMQ
jgi:hypothetical protein